MLNLLKSSELYRNCKYEYRFLRLLKVPYVAEQASYSDYYPHAKNWHKSSKVQSQPEHNQESSKDYCNPTNEQILGHELKHSYNSSTKKNLNKESGKEASESETDAFNFGNKIRKAENRRDKINKPMRSTYDGKPLNSKNSDL